VVLIGLPTMRPFNFSRMSTFNDLTRAQFRNRVDTNLALVRSQRPDLDWFWLTAFRLGLRASEVVNLPRLFISQSGFNWLINTYKGSFTREILWLNVEEPLRQAVIDQDYNWTLWNANSLGALYVALTPNLKLYYRDPITGNPLSQLRTHWARINRLQARIDAGNSIAEVAHWFGIKESTCEYYNSWMFIEETP